MPFQADTFRLFDLIFFLTNVIDEAGKIFFLNPTAYPDSFAISLIVIGICLAFYSSCSYSFNNMFLTNQINNNDRYDS